MDTLHLRVSFCSFVASFMRSLTVPGGIGERWATYVHFVTAEGENYILTQQTARYLLKALELSQMGKRLAGMCALEYFFIFIHLRLKLLLFLLIFC